MKKKILDVKIMFRYELRVFMLEKKTFAVNFKPYFTRVNNIQSHSTYRDKLLYPQSKEQFYPKTREKIQRNRKGQSYFKAF